jgi:hypothetical protein
MTVEGSDTYVTCSKVGISASTWPHQWVVEERKEVVPGDPVPDGLQDVVEHIIEDLEREELVAQANQILPRPFDYVLGVEKLLQVVKHSLQVGVGKGAVEGVAVWTRLPDRLVPGLQASKKR